MARAAALDQSLHPRGLGGRLPLSRDLDVALENPVPVQEIVASLTAGLSAREWRATHVQTDPLSGRFLVTDPDTGEECEVDVLKEAFWAPPAQTLYGPVLSLDDVIGTEVRALADRGTVRDLIDVQAASRHRATADLVSLGRRRAHDEFSLEDLRDRLVGADWYEDEDCTAYGLHLPADRRTQGVGAGVGGGSGCADP